MVLLAVAVAVAVAVAAVARAAGVSRGWLYNQSQPVRASPGCARTALVRPQCRKPERETSASLRERLEALRAEVGRLRDENAVLREQLARLAVDARDQGQGLGALLLAEALRKAVAAGEAAAARLVVVDAIDEAAARFYTHHGFVAVPDHPLRLYRRMKDIRASQ